MDEVHLKYCYSFKIFPIITPISFSIRAFKKTIPEIPQEIINNYKVDKYLVKPLWENLRNNLLLYLAEAEAKVIQKAPKYKTIWVEEYTGDTVLIDLTKIINPIFIKIFHRLNHKTTSELEK